MRKFEYRETYILACNQNYRLEHMTTNGNDGWELVTVIKEHPVGGEINRFFWKREIDTSTIREMFLGVNLTTRQKSGWDCPTSPTGECDYTQIDDTLDEDSCRYCGQPEERK